jgi:hypothetical protein
MSARPFASRRSFRSLDELPEAPELVVLAVPVDRIWRGTSEIQRLIIANEIGKRGLRTLLEFGTGAPREAMAHA